MANPFVHIEPHTGDTQSARDFYGNLLDWKLEDMDMGPMTYTMIGVGDDGTGGGIMAKASEDAPLGLDAICFRRRCRRFD